MRLRSQQDDHLVVRLALLLVQHPLPNILRPDTVEIGEAQPGETSQNKQVRKRHHSGCCDKSALYKARISGTVR